MSAQSQHGLYLDRRSDARIDFRKTIKFNPDGIFPLRRLQSGITQDLSLRGMQILSTRSLPSQQPFEVWIPLEGQDVIRATARPEWTEVEDNLADSPYWLRVGLSLSFERPSDRHRVAQMVATRAEMEESDREAAETKIGFVF